MKRKVFKAIIIIILIGTIFNDNIVRASLPLSGKIIVVDAGHGGLDPGTVVGSIYEKNINLDIALKLEKKLSKLGASVVLTRSGDYDLSKPNANYRKKSDFDNRIKIINESKADYYLSIHLNYLSDSSYFGPQVFYNNKQNDNKDIATKLQDDLNKLLNSDREVKKIPTKTYMYDKLKIKGVLIECGFLSNFKERSKLQNSEYQEKLAEVIAKSLSKI